MISFKLVGLYFSVHVENSSAVDGTSFLAWPEEEAKDLEDSRKAKELPQVSCERNKSAMLNGLDHNLCDLGSVYVK